MTNIIDILFELAQQNKAIRAFRYDTSAENGSGSELYPLLWIEDPILANNNDARLLRIDFNFSITGIPDTKNRVKPIQEQCFAIGLSIIEKLRKIQHSTLLSVNGFSALTLRDYYDNGAAGVRFSVSANRLNPQNLCHLDELFDPHKTFPATQELPCFDTPPGCTVFPDKPGLPSFNLSQ